MYWVYVLENRGDGSLESRDRDSDFTWYIGFTSDLPKRVEEHQKGHGARTTRRKTTWKLIYCEGYLDKKDAQGREKFLKRGSGRWYLKKQLKKLFRNCIRKNGVPRAHRHCHFFFNS